VRSNIIERKDESRAKRGPQIREGDAELAADIRRLVDERPTYGYRRIAALLKRERRSAGEAPVNAKRVFWFMLERHTGRRRPREHDGHVATIRSNVRWWQSSAKVTRTISPFQQVKVWPACHISCLSTLFITL